MINFRFHRGGFSDSISTKITLSNLYDVFNYVKNNYCLCDNIKEISVSYYSYDERLPSHSFIVCVNSRPCGFIWFE